MEQTEQLAWLKLILTPGLGPTRIGQLRQSLGEPEQIVAASDSQLAAIINPKIITDLRQTDEARLAVALDWLEAEPDHQLLTIDDSQYPALLKTIDDPPQALFIKGNVALLSQWQLAIVGSRNPTQGGRDTAHEFARYLSQAGLVITSGMALGIDGASHEGALDAGKPTIAVTGNGLDRVYPARHRELAHRIAEQGALVSEYPPGTKPLAQNFPRRNRIIAGLSLGTLVIEAAPKSGSLITAYKALEQSREVFAIPGSIHNPLARGCHQLIRQGAKLVETAQDVIEELGPMAGAASEMAPSPVEHPEPGITNPDHERVLSAVDYDPVNIDTLIERTGLETAALSSILLILELEGHIRSEAGGLYVRSH